MSCYFIAQIKINDEEIYKEYLDGFDTVFEKYNGTIVTVEEKPILLEGEWNYSRVVIFRFPSENEAKQWYYSMEYQSILKYRQKASIGVVMLINDRIK
jgi:uncharacterized protein (DUF1330 family)